MLNGLKTEGAGRGLYGQTGVPFHAGLVKDDVIEDKSNAGNYNAQ